MAFSANKSSPIGAFPCLSEPGLWAPPPYLAQPSAPLLSKGKTAYLLAPTTVIVSHSGTFRSEMQSAVTEVVVACRSLSLFPPHPSLSLH